MARCYNNYPFTSYRRSDGASEVPEVALENRS